jgi:hypothetical protein
MELTIVKDSHGQEHVHKAGCADLRKRSKGYRAQDAWTHDWDSLEAMYLDYWCNGIAEEAVAAGDYPTVRHCVYAWTGEFTVHPCVDLPEMPDPDADLKWELPRTLVVSAPDAETAAKIVREALADAGIEIKGL